MKHVKKRTVFCRRCGRTVGELGFSRTGVTSRHKCLHEIWCRQDTSYASCDKCNESGPHLGCPMQFQYVDVKDITNPARHAVNRREKPGYGPTCVLAEHGKETEHVWTER